MSGSKVKESDLEDRTLMCKDCGNKFIWTAGEQKFFLDKGLQNIPKRCKPCTAFYKSKLREKKPMFWIQCANCRVKSEVPFEVQTDDVLCEKCFNKKIEERNEVIKSIGETIPE